jgi:hypothetical protein
VPASPETLADAVASAPRPLLAWPTSHRLIAAGAADRARTSPFALLGLSFADALAVMESIADRRALEAAAAPSNLALRQLAELEQQAIRRLRTLDGAHPGVLPAGSEASALVTGAFAFGGPSRFSAGTHGCYYAAELRETAIAETLYYQERAMRDRNAAAGEFVQMVDVTAAIAGTLVDLRRLGRRFPEVYDPNSHAVGHEVGALVYEAGAPGILYVSVRRRQGARAVRGCVAVFDPTRVTSPRRLAAVIRYEWDGTRLSVSA